jgi:hypothetical protein
MTQQINQKQAREKKLWCGHVHISSLPQKKADLQDQVSSESKLPLKSWLFNYTGKNVTYIFEMIVDRGVALNFSIFTPSQAEAVIDSRTILTTLQRLFPHISGDTTAEGLDSLTDRFWNTQMYELICPKPPYHHFSLIENLTHVAIDSCVPFRVLIQFKFMHHDYLNSVIAEVANLYKSHIISAEKGTELNQKWSSEEPFSIRVFYQFGDSANPPYSNFFNSSEDSNSPEYSSSPNCSHDPNSFDSIAKNIREVNDPTYLYQKVIQQTMMNSVLNYRHQIPSIRKCGRIQLHDIFFHSGIGTIIIPSEFQGHFEHPFPIPRTPTTPPDHFISPIVAQSQIKKEKLNTENENIPVANLSINQNSKIFIGSYVHENSVTHTPVMFDIHALRQSMSVFGLTRTGKTTFLANMLHDIALNYRSIGQLILYLKNEQIPFNADLILDGNSPELFMPYLFAKPNTNIKIEELAGYIASGLGLLDNGRRYIINYCHGVITQIGAFPLCISDFLTDVLKYLDNPINQYGTSQGDIFQATKQRIETLIGNQHFTQIFTTSEIPEWFNHWMYDGAKIVIDLQHFNPFEQRFIVLGILQMIRTYADPAEDMELHRLYVIDEAHKLFYKPTTGDYYDSDNLGQYALDRQLDLMINELANCGIGGIFADQNPYKLLDSIRNQIGTTVLFRISRESAQQYSPVPATQEFYATMPDHMCFVESNPQRLKAYIKPNPPFNPENHPLLQPPRNN